MLRKSYFILPALLILLLANSALADSWPDFRDLAKNSSPAVVNVSTEREREQMTPGQFFGNMMPGSPFEDFFNQFDQFFGERGFPAPRKERSLGSGFIISSDGYIVTNNHVVEKSDKISVNLQGQDGKSNSYDAVIVGTDPDTDLALIKIEPKSALPVLSFGDSDRLEVGEWVIAIGNPFGLDHSVTAGIISAKGRNIQAGPFDSFLQTDASINPGNSGGPLINQNGEVVGINTAIIASGQGIGFAIPSNMAKTVIEQLRANKHVSRGWIGVRIQAVDENTAKAMGLEEARGALVGEVFADGPAEKAGLKSGDIILSVNDETVKDNAALLQKIASLTPGDKVALSIWREGKTITANLVLGERGSESYLADAGGGSRSDGAGAASVENSLGISVRSLTREEAASLNMPDSQGVVITKIISGKSGAESGLQRGDVIVSANMVPVSSAGALSEIVAAAKAKGAVLLQLNRRGQIFFRAVPLAEK